MSSYAQVTIHSLNSKYYYVEEQRIKKVGGEGTLGKIIKGSKLNNTLDENHHQKTSSLHAGDKFDHQIGFTEAHNVRVKISSEEAKKIINITLSNRNKDQTQLTQKEAKLTIRNKKIMEGSNQLSSQRYISNQVPLLLFLATMRNLFKEFVFPQNCKALPPNDEKCPLVYQIVSNLFNEITFFNFNILVCHNPITENFYSFFSDSEIMPFTKCCKSPAYIELISNGTGKILCNNSACVHKVLAEFIINFEDGQKLWKNLAFLNVSIERDCFLKEQIARTIRTGKFKNFKLKSLIHEASREASFAFENSKNELSIKEEINNNKTFLTNAQIMSEKNVKQTFNEDDAIEIAQTDDKNVESLKLKIHFMMKKQKELPEKFAKKLVNESKIFHKRFEMGEKLNEMMKVPKTPNRTTYLSFPRLMDQIKYQEKKRNKSVNKVHDQ